MRNTGPIRYDTPASRYAQLCVVLQMYHFSVQRSLARRRLRSPLHPSPVTLNFQYCAAKFSVKRWCGTFRHRAIMHQRTCGRSITIWGSLQAAPKPHGQGKFSYLPLESHRQFHETNRPPIGCRERLFASLVYNSLIYTITN